MNNAVGGQGNIVITGVQEAERGGGVAPVHLNGVGIRTEDGHILHDNEVYSQCLSQMSQTQRIIDHTTSPGASKFPSGPCLYQCNALLPRAQPCESAFCKREDFKAHCWSAHKISGSKFCKFLDIDRHNNRYILRF